ncbi:hypothetical protein [Thalassotalea ganghwensis]
MISWFTKQTLIRRATVAGVIGVCIAIIAFTYNYHYHHSNFIGYQVIVAPAILMLSFFTEEINFVPKMVLFLTGQFLGYFIVAYTIMKIGLRLNKS